MIVTIVNSSGQPIQNAVVSLVDSPLPHPDIGMITNDKGEIVVDIPVSGKYQFAIFDQNNTLHAGANLRSESPRARLEAAP
jgi:hypothetical protein